MDFLKSWALTICLCSILSALLYFVTPKGAMEKPVRTVLAIFLLTVLLGPLFKAEGRELLDFDFNEAEVSEQAENGAKVVQEAAAQQFCSLVATSLQEALKREGYEVQSIEVRTREVEYGEISVGEIRIDMDKTVNQTEVSRIVLRETGVEPIFGEA